MIAIAIRKNYGQDFKPKIIWLYITNNLIWSEPDLLRANAINVKVITENEMQYFDSFIKHMGPAGRFQFLAEFLQGQDIPELSNIKIPATRGNLGGQKFYSFLTTPRQLFKIAFVNHQALNHPDGKPAYQRMISPSRIKEIGEFIRGGGYFPTNLLINFIDNCRFDLISNKENADPNIKFGWLYLPDKYKSAWIIDGQHRLYGFSHLDEKYWDQNIAVIAFEKMDTKSEAELFVTINHKQKKVEQSIIVSLKSDLKWGSEDPKERLSALASRLIKTLHSDPTSPFFQRFSQPGVNSKENQSLTLPEIVKGLICSGLLGRQVHKLFMTGPLNGSTDEKTIDRARRILNSYFTKIRDSHIQRWDAGRSCYICTNPGIRANFLLIMDIIKYCEVKFEFDSQVENEDNLLSYIDRFVNPILNFIKNASDAEIYDKFSRKFGEGGVREYNDNLCEIINSVYDDFGSDEFNKRLAKKSDERIKETHQDVIKLSQDILDIVFSILKKHYGVSEELSGEKTYWEKGIESPKIKEEAYKKQLEDSPEKRRAKEAYLTILDLMTIVRQKNNWPLFEKVFNIPLPGEKGKTFYLDWMKKFNEIRRIPAHASSSRGYDESDYEFMKFIKYEFYSRYSSELGIQNDN
jgi:DGQHR domain-containing protein